MMGTPIRKERKMKKISLLLASIGAAALFVGGTFAAYVITDNANPIGKKISPSEITDDQTGNITLEWGSNTIQHVSNLASGSTQKMGNVVLRASGEDGDGSAISTYVGSLAMRLTDLTNYGETTPVAKLIDYLEVDVVSGDVSLVQWQAMTSEQKSAALIGHIPPEPSTYSATVAATGTASGSVYSVFITLSDSATPVYTAISTQVVYLQLDWNANASDANIEATTKLYFKKPAAWGASDVYLYAWKGSVQNAAFPGVQMKAEANGVYTYDLAGSTASGKDKFDKVVFSSGGATPTYQTVDLALDYSKVYFLTGEVVDGKYSGSSSATQPSGYGLANYYVTGKINGVDKWYTTVGFVDELAMGPAESGHDDQGRLANVSLKAGDQLCVIGSNGTYYHTDQGGDWSITEDGTYDIYLNSSYQVWVVKK